MADTDHRLHASITHQLVGVALISATLLMTELALTRIFSVVMYYHFAFLAISIALFGVSASGVAVYVARRRIADRSTDRLLAVQSLVYAVSTLVALFFLVRLRVGLTYSARNLALMLTIYALAAMPFFCGGLVIATAVARLTARINAVYAADLIGAASGCLLLIPLLDRLGAPGVVLTAAGLAVAAGMLFAPSPAGGPYRAASAAVLLLPLAGQLSGVAGFDVVDTKGHQGDHVLFSKWNSFSRVGVYERPHGDWSLSAAYHGPLPDTRYMDIDSAASTPILHLSPDLSNAQYLRYELTALAYHSKTPGFTALVIGPGGGRDIASALEFGARHVDGVEINPIIADDVMRGRFRAFSGGIYANARVEIAVDDGRSFVRRTANRYDVIQASLVDTWAATAAGAYTLTENTLYTVNAFDDYLDHLTDDGVVTITRWVVDGLRLVSLAQAALARRGLPVSDRILIARHDRVATFLLKRSPFTATEIARLRSAAARLQFDLIYAPDEEAAGGASASGSAAATDLQDELVDGVRTGDYRRLIQASDRDGFYESYYYDVRPVTDDRPFFFHTTKLRNQMGVAFGRSMLFGNGLSALLTLLGISVALVVLFVVGPLFVAGRGATGPSGTPLGQPPGWSRWLVYFGALGSGFMLIEVSVLQRFVLLLGHPVYSLTVTLFSLLLGTGIGAALSRRLPDRSLRRLACYGLAIIALAAVAIVLLLSPLISWAIPFARGVRVAVAGATLIPLGILLGVPMPSGLRLLSAKAPEMVAWAWGINGALSVVGATLAIFVAMNWGFGVTLLAAAGSYLVALTALLITP